MCHASYGRTLQCILLLQPIGNGVLLVAKALVMVWPPATVCLLQGGTALRLAAGEGRVAVVQTLLLSGADLEARDADVSCRLSIDTAYIACEVLVLISCSNCQVHVSCLIRYNNAVHIFVATILEMVCSLWQKQL